MSGTTDGCGAINLSMFLRQRASRQKIEYKHSPGRRFQLSIKPEPADVNTKQGDNQMSTTACDDQLIAQPETSGAKRHYSLEGLSPRNEPRSCFCIGPQNGDPVCPCRMRNVTVVDGKQALVTVLD